MITVAQQKKFSQLCDQMRSLMAGIQIEHPHATLFIEDGYVAIYDWPSERERRPDESLADGGCWFFASGGGK